jgi:long-chain acyl-CoA synthetase
VPQPGATVAEDELRAWAAERLACFKVPKRIELADALPRTASGKLLRRALRG